jgi:hypothetical protein
MYFHFEKTNTRLAQENSKDRFFSYVLSEKGTHILAISHEISSPDTSPGRIRDKFKISGGR